MIVWIERPLVLAIHDRQLAEHGGASGVRADALLDSALARPRQLLSYGDPPPDLAALAASLVYGLARNHPFVDGNKRTAAVACETFIVLNGASLVADDLELYGFYIGLADGTLDEAACAAWLRPRLQVRHQQRVNESTPHYG
ncbi:MULTISPECIES: type II toxin-antitoxin system death-on-curing family toxin [Xanthomonas]|uniref:Type II toxin-antitoxin system death-on-curing family toxin n=1 Tax=Xanthomonas cucurbitae TaxID=56453 RepID=A0A2S7DDE8_9XANT|nr:type II toxin-antitoxin system death-on-curing family toxin [Xanthomonas cucurbitae]PPU71754.1 type II toxin-antitoxin system death-on-curing family toxin [Xanthomonas cucurbitae]QHG86398.1 type II toxin-antitoxin system death-on-curing family toxin [Xanthomonas cucurbitae]WDM68650.1 type II toxin-antitoxin system death-on-curing family toxin [Xanthomonas cucurbitae]WDM72523.1 type II toxin-antitoxin system death-on-curing family toxin [Xanthomonas cucurbitae]WDM76314.1 type II toxin-antito